MVEVKITRQEIIVVDEVSNNSYGDLVFTDKAGNSYKVGKNRAQYFKDIIFPDVAVQLNYAPNPHRQGEEYISSAVQVEGELPQPTEKPTPRPNTTVSGEERGMWFKHKAFALSYSKDLVCAGSIDTKELLDYAQQMLDWLNKPMV